MQNITYNVIQHLVKHINTYTGITLFDIRGELVHVIAPYARMYM